MRAITIAIFIVMLASAAAAQDAAAPPVGTPPPSTQDGPATNGTGSLWQAPVGHRQPTLNSLPPTVRHDERSEADGQRNVDPFSNVPNICNGC
jgi:hypothetical protein